ncbi:hypothetical protein FISHEDRAFT_71052 [Fistulina hepatica ATCC 64428]|nr:hypothetical protein FISHEDRAFT_71052 [Fistulina hepatica ATCC 64428]
MTDLRDGTMAYSIESLGVASIVRPRPPYHNIPSVDHAASQETASVLPGEQSFLRQVSLHNGVQNLLNDGLTPATLEISTQRTNPRFSPAKESDGNEFPADIASQIPLGRQRTTQACEKCRERKTKCSGDRPVCRRCTARGLTCVYAKDRSRINSSPNSREMRFLPIYARDPHSTINCHNLNHASSSRPCYHYQQKSRSSYGIGNYHAKPASLPTTPVKEFRLLSWSPSQEQKFPLPRRTRHDFVQQRRVRSACHVPEVPNLLQRRRMAHTQDAKSCAPSLSLRQLPTRPLHHDIGTSDASDSLQSFASPLGDDPSSSRLFDRPIAYAWEFGSDLPANPCVFSTSQSALNDTLSRFSQPQSATESDFSFSAAGDLHPQRSPKQLERHYQPICHPVPFVFAEVPSAHVIGGFFPPESMQHSRQEYELEFQQQQLGNALSSLHLQLPVACSEALSAETIYHSATPVDHYGMSNILADGGTHEPEHNYDGLDAMHHPGDVQVDFDYGRGQSQPNEGVASLRIYEYDSGHFMQEGHEQPPPNGATFECQQLYLC